MSKDNLHFEVNNLFSKLYKHLLIKSFGEIEKATWKHSPVACVPREFLVLTHLWEPCQADYRKPDLYSQNHNNSFTNIKV